jgi:DNA polymerase III delta prime subunit
MAARKKMDLLAAIEQIVDKAKGTGLSAEFFRKADRYIRYVSEVMELTKEQSVMLALFVDNSCDTDITISSFGEYLGCRTSRLLRYMNDIDVLEKRELIRGRHSHDDVTYRVPVELIEALKRNEKYVPKDYTGLTCVELFGELANIFDMRENKELRYGDMVKKIDDLFCCNSNLEYVQKVKSYGFSERTRMLLILFTHLFVNNSDDNVGWHDLEFMHDGRATWISVKNRLSSGNHPLLEANIIENNNDGGFGDRNSFRMTNKAKNELFGELNLTSMNKRSKRGDIVRYEDIVPKALFYNEKNKAQVEELASLLDDEKYNQIRSRMKDTGFRCAFTCLLYGAPGTGKTETVLQLARQTGRDIMQVNISQIKSMWVGESEKNIKQVFDNYRAMVNDSQTTPILLFNEADAIIGKRQEGTLRSVDKMENSIQNIILQEMEMLDGILIATTNLAQNMDKAFERRFLYKIKFDKPTVEARTSMWREMIPVLNEEESRILAGKFDFSGGQIENIARHYTIGKILHGDSEDVVNTLSTYCESEKLESNDKLRIGFW